VAVSTAHKRKAKRQTSPRIGNEVVHSTASENPAREIPGGLRVPSHGRGMLMQPFGKGHPGNPGGRPRVLKEVRELAKVKSVAALQSLVACFETPDGQIDRTADGRVVAVAAQAVLTWAFGKPPDYDPAEDRPLVTTDFNGLTLEEKKQLLALVRRTVTIDPAAGAEREAELEGSHTVIESQAEPQTELAEAEKAETAPNEPSATAEPPKPGAGRMRIY